MSSTVDSNYIIILTENYDAIFFLRFKSMYLTKEKASLDFCVAV